MRASHRLLVAATLAVILGTPVATLHPFWQHVFDSRHAVVPGPIEDAAVVSVFVLLGASLLPAFGLTRIVANWLRGSLELRALSNSGRRVSSDGLEYTLLDAPQVAFFTAGIVRPRIYATSGAAEYLAHGAFRAGLLHERAHQQSRDVAWRAVLAAIERAFSPFTSIRAGVQALSLEAEFAADRAALAAGARRSDLFEAMVAAAEGASAGRGVGLATSGTLQRLAVLADPQESEPRPALAGLATALAALGVLPFAVHMFFWLGAVCF